MKNSLHSNVILLGYKSSGKTYFGKLLAQELGEIFIDTDQLIEELYEKKFQEKLNCRQISIKIGKEGFRLLEREIIDSLGQVTKAVISVGGGAVLNPENCLGLRKNGKLVYLEVDKAIIKQRIFSGEIPSFLDPQDLEQSFEKMYEERQPIYSKVSTFKVSIQEKTDRQVLDELLIIAGKGKTFPFKVSESILRK